MVAPANSRGHLFWYWRRFGAVLFSAAKAQASARSLASRAGAGFVRSGQLHAPAWASAVLGVAGRGDVLALAPFAFQDAHQDSVKVASHVVNHFTAAAFSDKTYRFI